MSITVIISTNNEDKNIGDCIRSALLLTNSILLIDTGSLDNTIYEAKKVYKDLQVIQKGKISCVEEIRMFSIKQVKTDWVFIIDADERINKELAEEINLTINNTNKTHFEVKRKNIFLGKKWLRYGGWYPDRQIRLIKKNSLVDWPKKIHSFPMIEGEKGILDNDLDHFFHPNFENMVEKTVLYEGIEANLLYKANKEVRIATLFRKYLGELFRRLIMKKGFLDGSYGIIESFYQAFSKTITYILLYEKYVNEEKNTINKSLS